MRGPTRKGGVESELGRFRRNHLVPVPAVASLGELNALLLPAAKRTSTGGSSDAATVGEAGAVERALLRGLAGEPFDASETAAPRVDAKSLVTVRQNRYSVPVALAGLKVSARIGAREIAIIHAGAVGARHERLHGRFGTSAQLDHYLELLDHKPGGLAHSLALGPGARARRLARGVRPQS